MTYNYVCKFHLYLSTFFPPLNHFADVLKFSGNGETIQIYDGRQSLSEGQKDPHLKGPSITGKTNTDTSTGNGEIHYLRDSDDEQPDSDEDPDDDLDI